MPINVPSHLDIRDDDVAFDVVRRIDEALLVLGVDLFQRLRRHFAGVIGVHEDARVTLQPN